MTISLLLTNSFGRGLSAFFAIIMTTSLRCLVLRACWVPELGIDPLLAEAGRVEKGIFCVRLCF